MGSLQWWGTWPRNTPHYAEMAVSNLVTSIAAPFMRESPSPEALLMQAFLTRRHTVHILLAGPHTYALVWLYSDVLRLSAALLLPPPTDSDGAPAASSFFYHFVVAPWKHPYAAARGALLSTPPAARSGWFLLPALALSAALALQPFLMASSVGRASAARVVGHLAACAGGLHCSAAAVLLEAEDRQRAGGSRRWWRGAAALGLSAAGALLFAAGSRGLMPELESVGRGAAAASGELKRYLDTGLDILGSLAAPLELASTAAGMPLPLEAGVKAAKGFMGGEQGAPKPSALAELARALWVAGPQLAALSGAGAALVALAALARA